MATTYESYEAAASRYLETFRSLGEAGPTTAKAITRGAGEISEEQIIDQASVIADISAEMVELSQTYLDSPDPSIREGISGQLLSQAAAELQLAVELLKTREGEEGGRFVTTRSTRGASLQQAIAALEKSMATPAAEGLPVSRAARRGGAKPSTLQEALTQLQDSANITATAIAQRVKELGGDIAIDLALHTEWAAVTSAAGLFGKDLLEKLEALKKGAGAILSRILAVAAKTLYNAYLKIRALLGKDVEEQARNKVNEWLENIKEAGKIEIFDTLVEKFYGLESFKKALQGSLARSTAEIDSVNRTTDQVSSVGEKFAVLSARMSALANVVNLGKMIHLPQVLLIIASIQVTLLAVVIYSGFDYIGYRAPRFPNLTKGVAELISEAVVPLN
ncbi:MAG: hypothetical protein EHM61_16075 [Acidobacteria bacterium]|nr:MAG: hypothetical protein EHM61_16075 [Acidobacteriota bacterium]